MINRILEMLEAERNEAKLPDGDYFLGKYIAYDDAMKIVQEVAKEYTEPVNKRCLTCSNYDGEEIVDNICYLCCKGFEDNYKQKGE